MFVQTKKSNNQKKYFSSVLYIFLTVVYLFSMVDISAQDNNLIRPYEDWGVPELKDTYQFGIHEYINELNDTNIPPNLNEYSNGVLPLVGIADSQVASELAFRNLEGASINGNPYDFAILVELHPNEGEGGVYRLFEDDFRESGSIEYLGTFNEVYHEIESSNFKPVYFTEYSGFLSFYNSLPSANYFFDFDESIFNLNMGVSRIPENTQNDLNDALDKFKNTELAKDPFVRLGLEFVDDIVLIKADSDNNQFTGAPSQYNSLDNTIYINSNDLNSYGDVVIFHELLQAGLFIAFSQKIISASDLELIKNLDKKYFSHFGFSFVIRPREDAYESLAILSAFKAFAIGYTYKVFDNHTYIYPGNLSIKDLKRSIFTHNGFMTSQQREAYEYLRSVASSNRFLNDVKNNILVMEMSGIVVTYNTGFNTRVKMYLLSDPKSEDYSPSYISYFINMFTNESSSVNKDIQIVVDKIIDRQKKRDFLKILPALTVVL